MSKQYWAAEKLNENLRKIANAGFALPTQQYRVQSGLTRVVIGNELRNAGMIRTYQESVDFLKRTYGDKYIEYTESEYKQDLKRLQDILGRERSYQGEVIEQRSRLIDIVKDAFDDQYESAVPPKIKRFSTIDLYNAVKQAAQMVKDTNAKSPMFYEYLVDILEGMSEVV